MRFRLYKKDRVWVGITVVAALVLLVMFLTACSLTMGGFKLAVLENAMLKIDLNTNGGESDERSENIDPLSPVRLAAPTAVRRR